MISISSPTASRMSRKGCKAASISALVMRAPFEASAATSKGQIFIAPMPSLKRLLGESAGIEALGVEILVGPFRLRHVRHRYVGGARPVLVALEQGVTFGGTRMFVAGAGVVDGNRIAHFSAHQPPDRRRQAFGQGCPRERGRSPRPPASRRRNPAIRHRRS